MYHYVDNKAFLNEARRYCSGIMIALRDELYKYKINSQPILVGSGAKKMVTQNENGPIDYDYDLMLLRYPENFYEEKLNNIIKVAFDNVLKEYGLPDCDDSTSSFTSKEIYFKSNREMLFSMDVCVIKNIDGTISRLIHRKKRGDFTWNMVPDSSAIKNKAKILKKRGLWKKVRDTYIDKKNFHLSKNEIDTHPSFICYYEAVNEIFNGSGLKIN